MKEKKTIYSLSSLLHLDTVIIKTIIYTVFKYLYNNSRVPVQILGTSTDAGYQYKCWVPVQMLGTSTNAGNQYKCWETSTNAGTQHLCTE